MYLLSWSWSSILMVQSNLSLFFSPQNSIDSWKSTPPKPVCPSFCRLLLRRLWSLSNDCTHLQKACQRNGGQSGICQSWYQCHVWGLVVDIWCTEFANLQISFWVDERYMNSVVLGRGTITAIYTKYCWKIGIWECSLIQRELGSILHCKGCYQECGRCGEGIQKVCRSSEGW